MWSPTGLLLGPGGIKGFMELGFLLYMEKHGLLENVDSVVGISVGAIIALLLVAGYSVLEIINEASKTDLFEDISMIRIQDIKQNAGLISQNKIRETLNQLIVKKFGKVLTMGELYLATGVKLHITSFKLDGKEPHPVHFSYLVHPEISCVEAAILSANIPIVFRRLFYQKECYIDGAIGAPYPIHLLDNGKRDVLGLYIQTTFNNQEDIFSYLRQIFYAGMIQLRNEAIKHASKRCRHVPLYSNNFDPIGLVTDSEAKVNMTTEGYKIAEKFFTDDAQRLIVSASNIDKIEEDI